MLQLLPSMHTVDDHTVQSVQQACVLLCQITGREPFAALRPPLTAALERPAKQRPIHPALHGTVLGLLYGTNPDWKSTIDGVIRGYLKGTRG